MPSLRKHLAQNLKSQHRAPPGIHIDAASTLQFGFCSLKRELDSEILGQALEKATFPNSYTRSSPPTTRRLRYSSVHARCSDFASQCTSRRDLHVRQKRRRCNGKREADNMAKERQMEGQKRGR